MKITAYRSIWLGLYLLPAIFSTIVFCITDKLDGDLIGYKVSGANIVIVASFAVLISYLVWMVPIFRYFENLYRRKQMKSMDVSLINRDGSSLAYLVFLVQLGYLLFNLSYGVNVAGSKATSDSWLRFIFYFFVPDWLFIVYYSIYRKTPGFLPNLLLYIGSNVVRGWFGMWIIILFLEGAYRVQEREFNLKVYLPSITLGFVTLPFFYQLKLEIRSAIDASLAPFDLINKVIQNIIDVGWTTAFIDSIWPVIMRFQHVSNVVGIIEKSSELSRDVGSEFTYFFMEGTPQYVIRKMFSVTEISDIHIRLLYYLIPEQLPVDAITNTHVGLVGWFWIAPYLFLPYLLYLVILSWVSIWVARKADPCLLLLNAVWFMWLALLMNGWFAAFIDFIQAMIVLILVRYLLKIKSKLIRPILSQSDRSVVSL